MADVPFGLGDVNAAFPRIDPSLLTGISNHMAELSRPTIPDIPANAFTQNLDIGPYISKRSWHQLVIIGNGFDLECGLPSSFSSFVSDRKKRLRAEGHSRESCYAKETDMEKRNIFLTFVLATLKTAKCRDLSNRPAVPLVA